MIYYQGRNGILLKGDCLELMPKIKKQVSMVLCDLPYGTTACKWDSVIPFEPLWAEYKRLCSQAIVLTAAQPFTSLLTCSNLEMFKYSLVWQKSRISHFAQAPYRFLTEHEDICVFSIQGTSKNALDRMVYNPQGTLPTNKVCKGKAHSDHRPSAVTQQDYVQTTTNYPKSILTIASDNAKEHPTQKPVALFEYLIKTYTNEGDTVLDNCSGSGTTAVACENTGRRWICIEREEKYCEATAKRLEAL